MQQQQVSFRIFERCSRSKKRCRTAKRFSVTDKKRKSGEKIQFKKLSKAELSFWCWHKQRLDWFVPLFCRLFDRPPLPQQPFDLRSQAKCNMGSRYNRIKRVFETIRKKWKILEDSGKRNQLIKPFLRSYIAIWAPPRGRKTSWTARCYLKRS